MVDERDKRKGAKMDDITEWMKKREYGLWMNWTWNILGGIRGSKNG